MRISDWSSDVCASDLSEIMLPEGAPERLNDRATLWNEVEAGEKRKDAQLAREVEFSIPRALNQQQGVQLAREFDEKQFVERGMVADRKSLGKGKSVSVRLDFGGRCIIKKKKKK